MNYLEMDLVQLLASVKIEAERAELTAIDAQCLKACLCSVIGSIQDKSLLKLMVTLAEHSERRLGKQATDEQRKAIRSLRHLIRAE